LANEQVIKFRWRSGSR